jgi:hypothetical protein
VATRYLVLCWRNNLFRGLFPHEILLKGKA